MTTEDWERKWAQERLGRVRDQQRNTFSELTLAIACTAAYMVGHYELCDWPEHGTVHEPCSAVVEPSPDDPESASGRVLAQKESDSTRGDGGRIVTTEDLRDRPAFGDPVGPWFRWFAWRPVLTDDRGWRWLRLVWRRRVQKHTHLSGGSMFWFQHRVSRLDTKP